MWSTDLKRAEGVASRLQAGTVWINDHVYSAADIRAPFGGVKGSGFGRVHGREGLREMCRMKWVETCRPGGFRPYYFPYGEPKLERLKSFLKWRHL